VWRILAMPAIIAITEAGKGNSPGGSRRVEPFNRNKELAATRPGAGLVGSGRCRGRRKFRVRSLGMAAGGDGTQLGGTGPNGPQGRAEKSRGGKEALVRPDCGPGWRKKEERRCRRRRASATPRTGATTGESSPGDGRPAAEIRAHRRRHGTR